MNSDVEPTWFEKHAAWANEIDGEFGDAFWSFEDPLRPLSEHALPSIDQPRPVLAACHPRSAGSDLDKIEAGLGKVKCYVQSRWP
jgi:hypothetical protein